MAWAQGLQGNMRLKQPGRF